MPRVESHYMEFDPPEKKEPEEVKPSYPWGMTVQDWDVDVSLAVGDFLQEEIYEVKGQNITLDAIAYLYEQIMEDVKKWEAEQNG